ncbi:transposase [Corynebacterium cystitidis]|uniref:transposase n=1 Tax=Corynebacterium cystitidis TaxID=35757 RepID=UPI0011600573
MRDVAGKTGIKETTLRNWARKAESANQAAVELSDAEKDAELEKLRRENKQLKDANEILKLALFAA